MSEACVGGSCCPSRFIGQFLQLAAFLSLITEALPTPLYYVDMTVLPFPLINLITCISPLLTLQIHVEAYAATVITPDVRPLDSSFTSKVTFTMHDQ